MKNSRFKINIIDMIILVLIIIAIGGVIYKWKFDTKAETVKSTQNVIQFYVESVGDYATSNVKEGDLVRDPVQNITIGRVKDVQVGEAIEWTEDSKGQSIGSTREGYASIIVTVHANGVMTENGLDIGSYVYAINKSVEIRAGKVALFTKVYNIYPYVGEGNEG